MDSSSIVSILLFISVIENQPLTVGSISASPAAGELFISSGNYNLTPEKTSALPATSPSSSMSSSSSSPSLQFTAAALTSAVTSVLSSRVDAMTDILSFDEPKAFVQLDVLGHLDPPPNKVGWSFEFYIKTDSPGAILLYATSINISPDDPIDSPPPNSNKQSLAASTKHEKQFISIEIINGKPALSIDDGEGIVNVHSDIFISDGLWHHINAVFSPSHLELTVDRNARTVKQATSVLSDRISPSSISSPNYLDLRLIYLGGVDASMEPIMLEQQVQTIYSIGLDDSSLVGCIREVKINRKVLEEKQIKLTSGISKEPKCKWQFICALDNPCVEDALCFQSGFDDFNCICESSVCTRSDFNRSFIHKQQFNIDTSTSGHKGHHLHPHQQPNQQQMNHLARSKSGPAPHGPSQSFPGVGTANGNLGKRQDEKSSQDVSSSSSVGGKKMTSQKGGPKVSDDLPAVGQSHTSEHRANPATSGPWGGPHHPLPPNLASDPTRQPGLGSSSSAHSTPSLDPSASLASVNSPSSPSSSSSFPELGGGHFTTGSHSSNERSSANGNNILGGQMSQGQNVIDSLHNINQINPVGGFASNAFNLIISKEQLLIVTVIIAVTIVVILFSTVIRAFYLLGKKSESRSKSKNNSTRSGTGSSSSSSSSCSSPAQLMKDTDNSCILPLTSTTTGSTSVAGSSSGGTSSSPLPFGSDCGYDHQANLDTSNALPNYPGDHSKGVGGGSTSGYGQFGHVHHHSIHNASGNHYNAASDHGSDLMNNHNLVMMMSRCSSASSLPSSPLPPPPDPLTTRGQFLNYAPGSSSYYNSSTGQSNQCDQIQLHPYPHPHALGHLHPHLQHPHHQGGNVNAFQHRNSEGDILKGQPGPSSHNSGQVSHHPSSHLSEMCESSESSHLLMPASTGMNLSISSPLSILTNDNINNNPGCGKDEDGDGNGNICYTSSSTGVTGCVKNNFGNSIITSYKSEENTGPSDHFTSGSASAMNDAAVVCLNYSDNSQVDKRHLARYSTYGTVSSGSKKSPNSLVTSQSNYTTDDLMDAYATYSRVDKSRDKNRTTNQISPQVQGQTSGNSYNRQHRLSISSPSSSSTSSASPYTNNNSNSNSNGPGETITITTNRRDSNFIYPLPPPSLFFSRQQRPNGTNNPSSPLLQDHNNLTSTFKWP